MSDSIQRQHLTSIFNKAIIAASPEAAVKKYLSIKEDFVSCAGKQYDLAKIKDVYVIGAGKGAAPMVIAIEELLGSRISGGVVCVKYEHALTSKYVQIKEASHPVPDQNGVDITKEMLTIAANAKEDDLVICLFTGGASALTPAFAAGIDLQDAQKLTATLLSSGASIQEMNTVRKHISTFSGGQLILTASPAQVLSLIVSDVVGDDLSIIASGPTTPDNSTYKDAINILLKYNVHAPQGIKKHLTEGLAGKKEETAKPNNPVFDLVQNTLVATNAHALNAAAMEAKLLGYQVVMISEAMEGEARDQSKKLLELARTTNNNRKTCIIAGGETTVTIKGCGLGGRNQEMALAASLEIKDDENIHMLFAGTDGTDGPTDAAGGFACPQTKNVMKKLEIIGTDYLDNNDAYHFLTKTDAIFKTGPTRTNVMDIAILIID